MGTNSSKNLIFQKSKKYYSDRANVKKKWFSQYGRVSEDNDYYANKKSITELFNLIDVVADNKLDEFRKQAQRLPDETINDHVNEVYFYNGNKINFWSPKTFASKLFAIRQIGYQIPDDINKTIRAIRNDTTHGNDTIVTEYIELDYACTLRILDTFAECLIAFGMLDEDDRHPTFEQLRIHEGSVLRNGDYYIGRLLGEGGSSRVYESTHKRLGNKVAIKELKPDKFSKDLIKNESSLLVDLKNDHIPKIYDVFSENGTYYIVMEYINGVTLDDHLKTHKLSENQKLTLSLKICDIMRYLHGLDKQIVFSDLKPQNILVNDNGDPYLIDFGVSKITDDEKSSDKEKNFYVSEGYTAPERYSHKDDKRADIYSYGMILRDIFGEKPGPAVSKIIDKCICYNPNDRFQNFDEVRLELQSTITIDHDDLTKAKSSKKSFPKWLIPLVAAGAGLSIILPVIINLTSMKSDNNVPVSENVQQSDSENTEKGFHALSEFQKLFEKAFLYAQTDDKENYLKLFKTDDNDLDNLNKIETEYKTLRDHIKNNHVTLKDYQYYYITNSGDYFGVGVLDKSVYNEPSTADVYSYNLYTPISESNGNWMFDYTEVAHKALGDTTDNLWSKEVLPFFLDSELQNNNRWIDLDDYSWMKESVVFDDIVTAKIVFIFQNNDGSVLVGVNIKNGTNDELNVQKLQLTASDEILGEIFKDLLVDGAIVPAKKSSTLLITIPTEHIPDSVKNQTWTKPEILKAEII